MVSAHLTGLDIFEVPQMAEDGQSQWEGVRVDFGLICLKGRPIPSESSFKHAFLLLNSIYLSNSFPLPNV